MSLREFVRSHVPLSTEAYLYAVHARRRASSRRRAHLIASSSEEFRLELGSGGRPGANGWVTVDTAQGCDIYWDLREPLPFPAGRVEAVYSSHLFEHLDFHDGDRLLAECVRVLKPGGEFSIAVPNARIYLEAYVRGTSLPSEYFGWGPAFHGTTAIDAANYVAYMAGEHRYMFDEENLLWRLRAAGLVNVALRPFDSGLDNPERDFETIYARGFTSH